MIPYGRQHISQKDIDAVVGVLQSDFLTQGPVVPQFEEVVSGYCGVNHAVAVCNATAALHIACMALGVGPGDTVWTSPITFAASANCARLCGADIDFIDIDPDTYNISIARLEEKLIQAEIEHTLPKLIIPVHLCGQSCDMVAIHRLSKKYGFYTIEDASHAIGAKYSDASSVEHSQDQSADSFRPVGDCRFSDIAVFSFHPVKIVTTGEGGMALTNSDELANRMRIFRNHGITKSPDEWKEQPANEIWNYQQIVLGLNYRMTDIQAALGISQMERLDQFVVKRHEIAAIYDEEFGGLPIQIPWQHPSSYSSYHLYPIRVNSVRQREIYDSLIGMKILVNLHYIPVYRQPYYEAMGFRKGYCEEAEKYFREAITLPLFPTLGEGKSAVIEAVKKSLDA